MERRRGHQTATQNNDVPIHQYILMETLSLIKPNEVRILSYKNPSEFYVYLPDKIDAHSKSQSDLQITMTNDTKVSFNTAYKRAQPVAVLHDHYIWHRAIVLRDQNFQIDSINVYFVDVGQKETVPISNIRSLPQNFCTQPAFAIPCRLYQIYPRDSSDLNSWRNTDPVHPEFERLMSYNATCKVCNVEDRIRYDVEINIPQIGDLGKYLLKNNFVSCPTNQMQQQLHSQQSPPGFEQTSSSTHFSRRLMPPYDYQNPAMQQQRTFRPIIKQPLAEKPSASQVSSEIRSLPLESGTFIITHVYSANEFYGHSEKRQRELNALQEKFQQIYNNVANDQSLSVDLLIEGAACVVQHDNKYHRVIIKFRESETRVKVKLVDRGGELIVDTSELLRIEQTYVSIPEMAQPFSLHNFDRSLNTAYVTLKLKRLILNERVTITQRSPMIDGFYSVEVRLSNDKSLKDVLSDENEPINSLPPKANDLPAPQKILTSETFSNGRSLPGRFPSNSQPNETKENNDQQQLNSEQSSSIRRGFTFLEEKTNERENRYQGSRDRSAHGDQTRSQTFHNQNQYNHRNYRNDHSQDRNNDENNSRGFENRDRTSNNFRGRFSDRGRPFERRGPRRGFSDGNRGRYPRDENRQPMRSQPLINDPDSSTTNSSWPSSRPKENLFDAGDHLPENEIPQNEFQFVISHFESTNDFFIQLVEKTDEINLLTQTLQNEFKYAPEFDQNSLKPNQICLAKDNDQCWYRAKIISTDSTSIKVRFVDFGNTNNVDPKSIRQIAKKFCIEHLFAYNCSLKNLSVNDDFDKKELIEKFIDKNFSGKLEKDVSNDKFILQSNDLLKLITNNDDIQLTSQIQPETKIPSTIVYVDCEKHLFYIQEDEEKFIQIQTEVETCQEPLENDPIINQMVIAVYQTELFRAIVKSDLNENVQVYYIDYGNTDICPKASLTKCSPQLETYPHQAKCCQLDNVSSNDLDRAFEQISQSHESKRTEISIVNTNDDRYTVRLFFDDQCLNDEFINDEGNSTQSTATTVKEQERPISATGKRNNDEILSPNADSLNTMMNTKRQKSESTSEMNSKQLHEGILAYVDKTKSMVYIQSAPDVESAMTQINKIIDTITSENKQKDSYQVGDFVIAQYTVDDMYYRARIESISDEKYTVYFLDFGNLDENIEKKRLFDYSNELENIEDQAHGYKLDNRCCDPQNEQFLLLLDEKTNQTIKYNFIDENQSIIHIELDNQPKTFKANISGTTDDSFYIHILPDADALIVEMDHLLEKCEKQHNETDEWNIDDLCIVHCDEPHSFYRGKILSIDNNDQYNVQCIDYGHILSNLIKDKLYLFNDENLKKPKPIARQCRLVGVNDKNQQKAINEIKNIKSNESVTITVENDQNDQCIYVTLIRENDDIVNDHYRSEDDEVEFETNTENKNEILPDSSDSAITADIDQHTTSPIGTPQAESTHQFGDTENHSITINHTIYFGENDSSRSDITVKDDSEN